MRAATWAFLLAVLAAASSALGQQWSFARIAQSGSLMPGTSTPFQAFELPSIDGNVVAFAGFSAFSSSLQQGVYTGSGGPLSVVADRHTLSPNGINFVGFAQGFAVVPSIQGNTVAFHAGDGIEGGVFMRTSTGFVPIATSIMPMPGGGGPFWTIRSPSLDNGLVAVVGYNQSLSQRGVYAWHNGVLNVVANRSTPIPGGGGTFTDFTDCFLHGGQIAFTAHGAGGYQGIFRAEANGTITRLYDTTMPMPGQPGNFELISRPIIQNGSVVFRGANSIAGYGIFTDLSGTLEVVANQSTMVPGSPGSVFGSFGYPAFDQGVIAFTASAVGGNTGVYSTHLGALGKVLAGGDLFDGRIVRYAIMGPQGLSGDSIALHVEFTNNSYGIYRATIPAPGAGVFLGLLTGAARRRRASHQLAQ
jgi:hypothetical protein